MMKPTSPQTTASPDARWYRAVKDFFTHMSLYLFMVIMWSFIADQTGMEWKWVIGLAIVWGLILGVHGVIVFRRRPTPPDERHLMELMRLDDE